MPNRTTLQLLFASFLLFSQPVVQTTPEPEIPPQQVFVYADGDLLALSTTSTTAGGILEEAGIMLSLGDGLFMNGLLLEANADLAGLSDIVLQVQRAHALELGGVRIVTTARTVGAALWEAGQPIRISDWMMPGPETPLNEEILIDLVAANPVVIEVGAVTYRTRSAASTVGEALLDGGLGLQGLDYSVPAADAPVPADGAVRVVKVEEEIILEQVSIPFESLSQPAPDLEIDTQQVIQVGAFGLQVSRIRVRYEDGVEVSRITETEWQAAAPQPRIVGYGTKIVVRSLDTPDGTIEYWRAVQAFATSYSPCRLGTETCGNTTASGLALEKGMVGVIRSWYNAMVFSQVYVPGYGVGVIADIGAGVSGQHWIDLGYSDKNWVSWAKTVTIYFLTPVPPADQILWLLP